MLIASRLKRAASVTLFFVLAAAAPLRAAENMQAGQWEFTSVTKGKSRTTQHCVTPTEASEANADVKTARAAAEKRIAPTCTVETYAIAGENVTFALLCANQSVAHRVRYHGDTYESTITTVVQGAKPLVTQVTAHRLGECTTPPPSPDPTPTPASKH